MDTVPMFPLGSAVVPGMFLPLRIFEPRYRELAHHVTQTGAEQPFATVLIERGSEVGGGDDRSSVGCIVDVIDARRFADGTWTLVAFAGYRIRVVRWLSDDPYPRALIEAWPDEAGPSLSATDIEHLLSGFSNLETVARSVGKSLPTHEIDAGDDPSEVVWSVAAMIPVGDLDRQRVLSAPTLHERFINLRDLIDDQRRLLEMILRQGDQYSG